MSTKQPVSPIASPRLSMQSHGSIEPSMKAQVPSPQEETDVESGPDQPLPEKPAAKDPNLVEWDGPNDPENPQNLPKWRKWVITVSMAMMTMWITFASSVFSAATQVTAKEYGVSLEVTTLGTSLVIFGFAVGPLIWAPMSELYGRRLPLFSGFAIFAIFQIPVAVAQNLQTILVSRFMIGFFGCSPLACMGGAMADIWDPVDRAVAIAMFAASTFLGPIVGPIM